MNVSQLETELDLPRASIRFYEKEGLLTGVSYAYEPETGLVWNQTETEQLAALMAMLAAQPEAGLFNWLPLLQTAEDAMGDPTENFRFSLAGLTVEQEVAVARQDF